MCKFFKINFFCVLLLLLFFSCSKGENSILKSGYTPGMWTMDYDDALKYAKEKKKLVLLAFEGSDWCGTCKKMRGNVFSTAEWKNFSKDDIVSVFLDFPKKENKKNISTEQESLNNSLKEKYQIKGIPTYVLLNSEGQFLGYVKHNKDIKSFISSIETYQ